MWSSGEMNGCEYWVKHFEEPSAAYGYKGGKMSKITIRRNGKCVFNYDRGDDVPPLDEGARAVLAALEKRFG